MLLEELNKPLIYSDVVCQSNRQKQGDFLLLYTMKYLPYGFM